MNKFQLAYIAAQAQHEERVNAFIAFMKPFGHMIDGNEDEQEAYDQIAEAAPDFSETSSILRTAETALIEWALNKVDGIAHIGEEKNAIETVRRNMNNIIYRRRVVQAAMKLG